MDKNNRLERSSLFRQSVNNQPKKFYNLGPTNLFEPELKFVSEKFLIFIKKMSFFSSLEIIIK